MCVYSMIIDTATNEWQKRWPNIAPYPRMPITVISTAELEKLNTEIALLKELLKNAKAYDEKNGEPECESASKVAILKSMAEKLGVEIDIL